MFTFILQLFTAASGRLKIELQSFTNDANTLADGSDCEGWLHLHPECDTRIYACLSSHSDCHNHDLSGNRGYVESRNMNSEDFKSKNDVPFHVDYPVRTHEHLADSLSC